MDCCKEEKCCPCESMAPRIECLQAQINELTEFNERTKESINTIFKLFVKEGVLKELGPLEEFKQTDK